MVRNASDLFRVTRWLCPIGVVRGEDWEWFAFGGHCECLGVWDKGKGVQGCKQQAEKSSAGKRPKTLEREQPVLLRLFVLSVVLRGRGPDAVYKAWCLPSSPLHLLKAITQPQHCGTGHGTGPRCPRDRNPTPQPRPAALPSRQGTAAPWLKFHVTDAEPLRSLSFHVREESQL